MRDLTRRIEQAFAAAGRHPEPDVIEELATHAASAYDAARADGCDVAEATAIVDRLIASWVADGAELRRRRGRRPATIAPAESATFLSGLAQDAVYAIRLLRRQRGITVVSVLTITLAIGAATTLFSVSYGVLARPLSWPAPERLVRIAETRKGHEPRVAGTMSNGPYRVWAADHSEIESIGGWIGAQSPTMLTTGSGEPMLIRTTAVTPSLFRVLQSRPAAGRLFVDAEVPAFNAPQAPRPIVVSYSLWQGRFGGRSDVLGRAVRLDGKPATIIGVMPADFAFPDRETAAWTPWLPPPVYANGAQMMTIFRVMARLRQGATVEQATAEGTARARSAPDPGLTAVALFGAGGPAEIHVIPAVEQMTAEVRPALLVLSAAFGLLLVDCIR